MIESSRKIQDPPKLSGSKWDGQTQRDLESYLRRVREALDGEAELRVLDQVALAAASRSSSDSGSRLSFFRGGC